MSNRWCIWIDIEGFSGHYERNEALALRMIGALLEGICRIGTRCFTDDQSRLFAHQGGDGVAIVSNYAEPDLERCAGIAVALMRHVTSANCVARAAIAEGGAADVSAMYPACVREREDRHGVVRLGSGGLLTLTTVMGTALIRSIVASKIRPSGPLLYVPASAKTRIPATFSLHAVDGSSVVESVDWLRASSPLISEIQRRAELWSPSMDRLETMLKTYCSTSAGLTDAWKASVRDLLGVPV